MNIDYKNKVVIVTGGANGIGKAAALQFANEGAQLVVADINVDAATEVAKEIGDAAIAFKVDVAEESSCQALIAKAVEQFGRLDVIFNNAGIAGARGTTAEQNGDDWRRVIDINLNGVFYCTKYAISEMLKTGGGVIVNTASVDGLIGMAGIPHYTAAKHGVIGFTKACAREHGGQNIRCVSIAPGFIDTAMTQEFLSPEEGDALAAQVPNGRRAQPGEVANMVLWLASDQASYVNGSYHVVDAGLIAGIG